MEHRSDREPLRTRSRLAGTARFSSVVACLLATACSGTGDGGTGDVQAAPNADVQGNGNRLAELLGPAEWLDAADPGSLSCDKPADRRVRVTGVSVVAIDEYDETGEGASGNVYVMDVPGKKGPKPYSGITVFGPSFSPPDLRLFGNEVVDVEGNMIEFLGPASADPFGVCKTLPEIGGTMTFRYDADQVAPLLVVKSAAETEPGKDRWAPLKSYDKARAFIGMLVRIEDVTFAVPDNKPEGVGRWSAPINVGGGLFASDVPRISNELYNITGTGPAISENGHFHSVTGIVTYFYGFKIAPRSPADFVRDDPSTASSGAATSSTGGP